MPRDSSRPAEAGHEAPAGALDRLVRRALGQLAHASPRPRVIDEGVAVVGPGMDHRPAADEAHQVAPSGHAEIGKPFAIALANVARSGVTPNSRLARRPGRPGSPTRSRRRSGSSRDERRSRVRPARYPGSGGDVAAPERLGDHGRDVALGQPRLAPRRGRSRAGPRCARSPPGPGRPTSSETPIPPAGGCDVGPRRQADEDAVDASRGSGPRT